MLAILTNVLKVRA